MWDDVIIGSGTKSCSAVKCYEDPKTGFSISENSNSYWISDLLFDMGMTVYKDTEEGLEISRMINVHEMEVINHRKLKKYLDMTLFKYIPYERLMTAIETEMEKSYEKGKEDKLKEIKEVLDIRLG